MASVIRVNTINSRSGLSTVTFDNSGAGVEVAGIVTATSFSGAVTGTSSGNPTLTNGANNRIITATGANALTGENNLQWDGETLYINRSSNTIEGLSISNSNNSQGSAAAQLNLSGGDNSYSNIRLECNGTSHHIRQDGSGNLKFYNNTTERLRIKSDGEVSMALLSSLITNGDFSNGTTNWTASGGSIAVSSGVLTLTPNAGVNGFAYQAITTVAGKHYNVQVDVTQDAASYSRLYVGTSATGSQNLWNINLGVGTHSFTFKATATTHYISLVVGGGTQQATKFDNVRVIESNAITFSTPTGDSPSIKSFGFNGLSLTTGGTDRLIIDSAGLVRVGKNDISSNTQASTLRIQGSYVNAVGAFAVLDFRNRTNAGSGNVGPHASIRGIRDGISGGNYSAGLTFHTNSTAPGSASDGDHERLRIASTGSAYFGLPAINNFQPEAQVSIISHKDMNGDKDDASKYHLVLKNPNNDTGEAVGLGFAITDTASKIGAVIAHKRTAAGSTGELSFYVRHANGSAPTRRLRIGPEGGLAIGSIDNGYANSLLVQAGVYISAYNGDNLITNGSQGGGASTLYIGNQAIQMSSDKRIKKNIVDTTTNVLDKIKQVRVVDFDWDDPSDTASVNRNSRGKWTGCLAQEMVDIFPHVINAPRKEDNSLDYDSDRTWLVDYGHLVPTLIKGMQEQQKQIEELKAEVTTLKSS